MLGRLSEKQTLWKQINFRSVKTILGVEFLHDLYNRHWPPINSVRFRNTVLTVKKEKATSYAPKEEWNFLAEWFGERFIRGDKETYEEVTNLVHYKKPRLRKLLTKLKSINFRKVGDIELGFLLIDLQYTTLSEIYRVNLVQIEHALNYAIDQELKKYYPKKAKRNEVIANIIMAAEPTVAMQEEKEFINIVYGGAQNGIHYLSRKKLVPKEMSSVLEKLRNHHYKFSFVHSAYGTSPYSFKYYLDRYNEIAKESLTDIESRVKMTEESVKIMNKAKEQYLHEIKKDKILIRNINLISAVGTLRDKNKALLGTTMAWREKILDEISRRKNIKREKLNQYFLAEICNLLKYNRRIAKKQLMARKRGFVLTRRECIDFNLSRVKKVILSQTCGRKILKGVCASSGNCEGIVKIIKTSKDIHKMQKGNVMVSPGTDFDLINAMQEAGAIITEEGGILSHAAVVSRELGIPCIIGVQGATFKLKDGMKVKVRADQCKVVIRE